MAKQKQNNALEKTLTNPKISALKLRIVMILSA